MSYVSIKLTGNGLAWLKIPKVLQNDQKYTQKTRNGQVSFVYWISKNKRSYEIAVVDLSLTPSVGQFKIFLRSCWLVFSDFFHKVRRCLHKTRNEISFRHEKNSVCISFYCRRNEMKLTLILIFWFRIFVFMKYLQAQKFPFGWFHLGVVFT